MPRARGDRQTRSVLCARSCCKPRELPCFTHSSSTAQHSPLHRVHPLRKAVLLQGVGQTKGARLPHIQLSVPHAPSTAGVHAASRAALLPYAPFQTPYALTLHAMVGPRLPRHPSPRTWARPPFAALLSAPTPLLRGARSLQLTEVLPSSTSTCAFASSPMLGSAEEELSWSPLADGEGLSPAGVRIRCTV